MAALDVCILYNEPVLPPDDPDWAQEAGVLESVEASRQALTAHGHRCSLLPVREDVAQLVADLRRLSPDVVLNFFEGQNGSGSGEANLAGVVQLCGLPLTGAPPECLALARDKVRAKWLLAGAGLPTPRFHWLDARHGDPRHLLAELPIHPTATSPWIVKPAREDASLGISFQSVVTDEVGLERQVVRIVSRYGAALIEQYIAGREFNVGVVALPEPRALPLAEVEFGPAFENRWHILTYDSKWKLDSPEAIESAVRCPAQVSGPLAEQLEELTLRAFNAMGCHDYGRVDFRVDANDKPWVLEFNANPDLSPAAGYARALRVARWDYNHMLCTMVEQAARRGTRQAAPESTSIHVSH